MRKMYSNIFISLSNLIDITIKVGYIADDPNSYSESITANISFEGTQNIPEK